MSKPNTFTIAVLTSMLFTSIAVAQSYPIKLTRDEKIGDQYTTRISGSVKHTVQLTVSGQVRPKSSDHLVFDLRGLVKILAVNPRTATATRITCRITRFTRNGDEVCPAGALVAAELKDGKTTYTIDGKAADEKDMDLLNMVLELEDPETTGNSDDIAGTDKLRAIGDTWPINTDNFSKAMNAGGLPIGTGIVKGESKLLSVKKENGQAVMEVETVATAAGFKKELKTGSTLSDGSMKVQVNVVVPVDPKLPMISSTTRSHLSTTITEGTLKRVVVEDRELEELHEAVKP